MIASSTRNSIPLGRLQRNWLGAVSCFALEMFPLVPPLHGTSDNKTLVTPVELPEYVARARRNLSIESPPTTLSLVTNQTLKQLPISSLADLSGRSPSLNVSSTSLRSYGNIYTMRGIGNTAFFSSPSVVFYVDDVPMGETFAYAFQLFDIEDLEILRGSQATLFGRNSAGGVIAARTPGPTEQLSLRASFGLGEFGGQQYSVAVSGPIATKKTYFTAAGYSHREDGFIKDAISDQPLDNRDALGGRLSFQWLPNSRWDLGISASAERFRDGAQRLTPLAGDPFTLSADFPGRTLIDRHNQTLRVQGNFPWGMLLGVTNHLDWRMVPNALDLDLSPLPGFTSTIFQSQRQWTQEIRLTSADTESSRFRWRAGAFFLTSDIDGEATRTFIIPPPPVAIPVRQDTIFSIQEDNFAFYGSVSIMLGQRLQLQAGVRYDDDEKRIDRVRSDGLFPDRVVAGGVKSTNAAAAFKAAYSFSSNLHLFASSRSGFKPAGFSAFSDDPAIAQYGTEYAWTHEFGVHVGGPKGLFDMIINGFWTDIDDYQVERTFTFTDYLIVNAARSRVRGLEFECNSELIEGFNVNLAIGYSDFSFQQYRDPFSGQDFAGNRAPYVPEFTLSLGVHYAHPKGWFGRLDLRTFGETFFSGANVDSFRQANYAILNASAGFSGERLSFMVTANNLSDERYYTNIVTDLQAGVPGAPRQFGFRVAVEF